MEIKLEIADKAKSKVTQVIIIDQIELKPLLSPEELIYVQKRIDHSSIVPVFKDGEHYLFIKNVKENNKDRQKESFRRIGSEITTIINRDKLESIQLWGNEDTVLSIAEGMMLSSYKFEKYKTKPSAASLKKIIFSGSEVTSSQLKELHNLVQGVYLTRDLVNEPVIYLTAVQLGEELKKIGKEAGFNVEVFNKKKIESLKMGGLIGVNKGSQDPPTFSILEYKPAKAVNKKPYILIGKGVVYDTGGLSLKDSDGMSIMKCDMAGASAVAGTFYAVAKNKLPVHIVGLIPATDNRPGENAITPGDVIKISNGKTVEVLNTDAEGRLILADALSFASRYKPELVIDLATLTGAAARAIGKEGIVFMGNAFEGYKEKLKESGNVVHERLVEFPLWEEYGEQLKSDIADIKNIGSGEAGAITAGKFLEHFVDYDWLHLDIAGSAFLNAADYYRSKNATGVGVRLLYNFFKTIK